jgi:hypothetical protein
MRSLLTNLGGWKDGLDLLVSASSLYTRRNGISERLKVGTLASQILMVDTAIARCDAIEA